MTIFEGIQFMTPYILVKLCVVGPTVKTFIGCAYPVFIERFMYTGSSFLNFEKHIGIMLFALLVWNT